MTSATSPSDELPASRRDIFAILFVILKDNFSRKARALRCGRERLPKRGAFVLFGVLFAAQHNDP
jgi:hypothetical protein